MDWSETIENDLPAPRDDEPQSLRRDIADELADHLGCAMDRERRRSNDEQTARNNVLSRFGDPRRIARRLWLEWMKEKIMTQRINLAALAVVAVASIVAASLSWYTLQETRDVTATILDRLEGLTAAKAEPPAAPPSEWTQLEVRCVEGEKDGPPAPAFRIELSGPALTPGSRITLSGVTDSNGRTTFSPVRIGEYKLTVRPPWPPELAYQHTRQIVLLPKPESETTIVCPAQRPGFVDIDFKIDWPAETVPDDVFVGCYFRWREHIIETDGDQWRFIGSPSVGGYGEGYGEGYGYQAGYGAMAVGGGRFGQQPILLTPDGKIIAQGLAIRRSSGGLGSEGGYGEARSAVKTPVQPTEFVLRDAVRWLSGPYVLQRLSLYRIFKDPDDPEKTFLRSDGIVHAQRRDEFIAEKGRNNTWTITVPESLLERLADGAD